jgi:hypothetical protein
MIKSKVMRWEGHVTHVGEKTKAYEISVGISEGKRPLEDLRLDGRIILGWIFTNVMNVSAESGYGQVPRLYENSNGTWCSINCGQFLDLGSMH